MIQLVHNQIKKVVMKQIKIKRCAKKEFVRKIWDRNGGIFPNVTQSNLSEFVDGKDQKMTLYYSNDVHIGTWQSGSGWYYSSLPKV